MSKELKIEGNFGRDFQQIYVGDEPTNIFVNKDGQIRSKSLKETLDNLLMLSSDRLEVKSTSKDLVVDSANDLILNNNSGVTSIKGGNITSHAFILNGFYTKEGSNAAIDVDGFGQLWVKDDTPNNLYFTDDTGQDIQITNNGVIANQKFFLTSSFFHGSSNDEFIPLAGGSTIEQTSLGDFQVDDTNFIVPYDLKINFIYANVSKATSATADPGNTTLQLYKGGSTLSGEVTVNLSSVGFDTTNIHTVYTWDFRGETNSYSAGEVMQIEIDPTSTLQYVSITIAGEYT